MKAPSSSSAPRAQAEPRSQPAHTAALGRGIGREEGVRACEEKPVSDLIP